MVIYDEVANFALKLERKFKEETVYNVVATGGIKVGKEDHKLVNTRFVSPQDLNSKGTLFGGTLLYWFDYDAAAFAYECVKSPCVFTTVSVAGFNFKKPVLVGNRVRGTMRLVHTTSSTLAIKGTYEVFENEWIICAEGYCILCAVMGEGNPTLLPELVEIADNETPDWEFIEKYKKINRKNKK